MFDASGLLHFENAAQAFAQPESTSYEARWFAFDNATGASSLLGESASSKVTRLTPPPGLPAAIGSYVRVDIRLLNAAYPSWSSPVQVYFSRMNDGWKLKGLYRK